MHPHRLLREVDLRVEGPGAVDVAPLRRAFPPVRVSVHPRGEADLDHATWHRSDLDLWSLDRKIDAIVADARPLRLSAPAGQATRFALEVLTRAQRCIGRRNAASREPSFDRALEAHAALHDLSRPAMRVELDRALDAWQWTLRLDPWASAEVQLAALLHDVERLVGGDDEADYPGADASREYREARARAGAPLAHAVLRRAGVEPALASDAALLVARMESFGGGRPDVQAVCDADALSFISLGSEAFVDTFGRSRGRAKIAHVLGRMSTGALAQLPTLRLRPDIGELVAEVLDAPYGRVEAAG
jgi:hypothetical protein